MADTAQSIAGARKRRLSAAKRSLKLVRDVADQHAGLLESGQVPEADFVTSAVKYAQALGELRLLDMITEGGENGADGVIELESGDVAALLETVQAFVPAGVLAALPPLARVSAAISGQPEDPAGPEPEPAQEQGQ